MVSAQIGGIVRFYRKTPTGNRILLYASDVQAIGTGGSSEGSIAQTYEKWASLPKQTRADKVLQPNDQLVVTFEATVGATTDSSDGQVVLPLTLAGGSLKILGGFDNSTDWDVAVLGDVALLAQETVIAVRTVREVCVLGSDSHKAFVSIENNA